MVVPISKQQKISGRNGSSPQERGLSAIVGRGASISSSTQTIKPITRVFHAIGDDTCGVSTTAATKIQLVFAPPVSIISTYDRYLVKKIKVHIMPKNTSTGGIMVVGYDATGHTVGYATTAALLSLEGSQAFSFSPNSPNIETLVINRPAYYVDGGPDLLRYEPVGTGSGWKAGEIFVGSMSQANQFTVWFEWEVELISPRNI